MKFLKILKLNFLEIFLFLCFFTYFSFWLNLNFNYVEINNNSIETAIKSHKFNPYISSFVNQLTLFFNLNNFLGFVVFPSLVAVILYKIFLKLTGSYYWSFSLLLLSIISTENFPFIKFLANLYNFNDLQNYYNIYENFEIQGFPIPSFSIFYFCSLFYFYVKTIKFNEKSLYIFSAFWFAGPFVHPFDGLIGLIFWNLNLFLNRRLRNITLTKKFLLYLIIFNILTIILISNQININDQILFSKQSYPLYNIFVYFVLPIILITACIVLFKVDFYEFYQKFLAIYILLIIEVVMILFSILGFGFDIKMTETRITMFLLHFLYYVPIIYYLNKDDYFLMSFSDNKNFFVKNLKIIYHFFCKFNKIYLGIFSLLIIFYLIKSLKI